MNIANLIRTVPDFPKKGISFKDITTVLKDAKALAYVIEQLSGHYGNRGVTKVVGIESRGFIVGTALAYTLGAGFVPVRKPGKLPAKTTRQNYLLEYGSDAIEIHDDAITAGENVIIHDDVLATGGTMAAACQLVRQLGGNIIGLSFLVELSFLHGRKKLEGHEIISLVTYDAE